MFEDFCHLFKLAACVGARMHLMITRKSLGEFCNGSKHPSDSLERQKGTPFNLLTFSKAPELALGGLRRHETGAAIANSERGDQ